ncbi:hypothetical protein ABE504_22070 [Paenibacillus oryzisoli]|uniref:hypothetical protein n=1 Tax=Paenibacillus oryzisoli TaxID=1850517 RepID=UPI003D28F35E
MGKRAIPGVSIITCTNRPQFFNNIVRNFQRQQYPAKELIIILNQDSMPLAEYRRKVRDVPNVRVYQDVERTALLAGASQGALSYAQRYCRQACLLDLFDINKGTADSFAA